eukprot:jgi/Astpho2/556/fgenesh1_pm.00012_%23_2_t
MASGEHLLAFRVLRLAKPTLTIDQPLRAPECHNSPLSMHRIHARSPLDAGGISPYMELPQAFGVIYLGETFCSYISVSNFSSTPVSSVGAKAELQTERQKVVLYDNSSQVLPSLGPGGRHDFIVRYDVKELGSHTLACSVSYTTAEGGRKYLPQYFKFVASNPISIKTKTRSVNNDMFLEACVENATKGPLVLEYMKFAATPPLTSTPVDTKRDLNVHQTEQGPVSGTACLILMRLIIDPGGTCNFLYRLHKQPADTAGNALGKLEIKWHGTMGEVGRLQTQQIMGSATWRKEAELVLVAAPAEVVLERPFTVQLKLRNQVDRPLGPLHVTLSPSAAASTTKSDIVCCGLENVEVQQLDPKGSANVQLTFVAVSQGSQRIAGIACVDQADGKLLDVLSPVEVLVK